MNKRTLLTGVLALTLIVAVSPALITQADSSSGIAVQLNGSPIRLSVSPQLIGSTLMVPFRELSEALGAEVEWNEGEQSVTATKGDRTLHLAVGSKDADKNGQSVRLDEAPLKTEGRVLVPLRFFSEAFDFNVYWDGLNQTVSIADADKSLPTVGSREHLESLLKDSAEMNAGYGGDMRVMLMADAVKEAAPAAGAAGAAGAAKSMSMSAATAPASTAVPQASGINADHSATNVQVQGVDEADVIKTDGSYIYQVNRNRVLVIKAQPAEQMSVIGTVYFEDKNFNPREIYVDDKHLIVIGGTYATEPGSLPKPVPLNSGPAGTPDAAAGSSAAVQAIPQAELQARSIAIWHGPVRSSTKTLVYDLTDRSHLKLIRDTELEGNYVSSRKVDSSLYVVTNKNMNRFPLLRGNASPEVKQTADDLPAYRDSAAGDGFIQIGYEDIRYFPKSVVPQYLLIGALPLDQPEKKMQVTSYLGSGNQVYASVQNLYVTANELEPAAPKTETAAPGGDAAAPAAKPVRPVPREMSSVIYKFGMEDGTVSYKGRGKVPGTALNQYAMDEQDGYFRIATTKGDTWRNDEYTSKNNVYVLNESMATVGKIEDIAPGERIYSVRFMGSRAYMVTFKQTDPLFVLDLKDPAAPKILGQLKIPGYSDYLHPYDENHLIGFGKDAVEVPAKNGSGGADRTVAYHQGMKLALFDVTDVEHPVEMFKQTIGDRGTDSELLHNPKALLFSKEKNVLAFPISVAEVKNKAASGPEAAAAYGNFVFQGAYVYSLDLTQGFRLRGTVTHLTADDVQKAGRAWYGSERNINRLLYIGDTLYSASMSEVKANDLATLKETGSVQLPPWKPNKP
ncbi:beta-propeller domain-containing protein [Paenibacillus filicis]|uniref:Beta-propeller domain-containing protein n=1 Tax=Paenibacillus gyeongsangnamensis TaxID=3388067 RepID=A0ABT4Q5F9_9BACL|nr:beta-propeller domain-containing protein [Paenibacillus filicis]MCZ8512054.1 beta-propeller domain-containing protein [Paenibacillus filicis]